MKKRTGKPLGLTELAKQDWERKVTELASHDGSNEPKVLQVKGGKVGNVPYAQIVEKAKGNRLDVQESIQDGNGRISIMDWAGLVDEAAFHDGSATPKQLEVKNGKIGSLPYLWVLHEAQGNGLDVVASIDDNQNGLLIIGRRKFIVTPPQKKKFVVVPPQKVA